MADKLDQTAGSETYQAGTGEMAMPTNGGNYGTTPAPEGTGSTPAPPPSESDMVPNVSGSSDLQVGHILGGPGPSLNSFAGMPK